VGLLLLTPWRRGPLLLLRRPGVFVALAAAAFVAALPTASAPLFLLSARNATLHNQVAVGCPSTAGATTATFFGIPEFERGADPGAPRKSTAESLRDQRRAATALTPDGLSAPRFTIRGIIELSAPERPADAVPVNLISRDDFAGHVEVREGTPGPGLWLPHRLAESLGVRAGGHVGIESRRLRVAAVYTDLRSLPDAPYWCGLREVYRGAPGQEYTGTAVYDMVLLDQRTYLDLTTALGGGGEHLVEWSLHRPQELRYEEAVRINNAVAAFPQRLRDTGQFPAGLYQKLYAGLTPPRPGVASRLSAATNRAAFVHDALGPPVVPITAAGIAVGLLVVGAAAVFWVQRRQRELAVLAAHGVSSAGLGVKAVMESLPALIVGAVAGGLVSWTMIGTVGPDPVLSPAAPRSAALGVAATLLVACLVVGVAAGLRTRSLTDQVGHRRRTGRLAALPWEVLLFVAAAFAWRSLGDARQVVDSAGTGAIVIVPARLLVVPILVVAGLVVLAGRIGVRLARRRRRHPRSTATGLLARRRLTRHAVIAAVLAGATATPVALSTYGGIVTNTIQSTVESEAQLQVGSDVVATLSEPADVPAALTGRATPVTRLSQVSVDRVRADLLAVDPDTFAAGAYWHGGIPGPTLAELAGRLRGGDQTLAIGTGVLPTGDVELSWGGDPIGRLTVARTSVLPGGRGGYPVLLVDRSTLDARTLARGSPEIWVRGDVQSGLRTLAQAGVPIARFFAAEERFENTAFEALTFTFGYLAALSLLTGLVSLVGLLLYLESRTPVMRRGYVLLRRMGLPPGAHRRILLVELGVPLLLGLAAGLAMVAALTVAVRGQLELDPSTPPGPLLSVPVIEIAGMVGGVLLVAVLAALFAHARTRRAAPSEVLRDAN
jgi:putative ABC transport system permease protein